MITLPDEVFARLQALAEPLVDSPEDVVRRLLDHYDHTKKEMVQGLLDHYDTAASETERGDTTSPMRASSNKRRAALLEDVSLEDRGTRERGTTIEINGHEIRAVSVTDLYEQALQFLVENGHARRLKQIIPFKTSTQRYLVSDRPVHPNGHDFFVPVQHKEFCMEAHKGYRTAIEHLAQLAEHLGLTLRYRG